MGAMLAGLNDGPGTARSGAVRIGLPALAGTCGLLAGAAAAEVVSGWLVLPVLFAVGMVSGLVSVLGRMGSAAGTQLMVATILGIGMPLTAAPWSEAGYFLLGGGWLVLLRLTVRWPRSGGRAPDSERTVASVFDALADALEAAGGPGALSARRKLTSVLDHADETLRPRRGTTAAEARLRGRFAAVGALCEASVALLWEARPLSPLGVEGVRRLATAVRSGSVPGPLPPSGSDTAAGAAFDRALQDAAVAFGLDEPMAQDAPASGVRVRPRLWRRSLAAAGRRYGLQVAVSVVAGAAVALALHAEHWYWLPLTSAFLVKPDVGPLFSRVVSRFAGTVSGVLLFAGVSTVASGWMWWPVALAALAGGLVPASTRHFALSTAVLAIMVLALLAAAGNEQAAWTRLTDTVTACGIVLLVGHLPRFADHSPRVRHRVVVALRGTEAYLQHVLTVPPGERVAERRALRRAAYTALNDARAAAETATAELFHRFGTTMDFASVLASSERIVDATTAFAVRMADGSATFGAHEVRQVATLMVSVADRVEHSPGGQRDIRSGDERTSASAELPRCRPLADIVAELEDIREAAA
jgi:hypothetical protein